MLLLSKSAFLAPRQAALTLRDPVRNSHFPRSLPVKVSPRSSATPHHAAGLALCFSPSLLCARTDAQRHPESLSERETVHNFFLSFPCKAGNALLGRGELILPFALAQR